MSAYKARQVLDLIRGRDADRAEEILNSTPREAARVVGKVLASAVANARNNDQLDPEELFVSACYADEGHHPQAVAPPGPGPCHPDPQAHLSHHGHREPAARGQARAAPRPPQATETAGLRSRRVAASRRGGGDGTGTDMPRSETKAASDADVEVEDLDATSTDVVEDGDGRRGRRGGEDGVEVDEVDGEPSDDDEVASWPSRHRGG